jgi:hypothetical protein
VKRLNWKFLILKHLLAFGLIYGATLYFPPFNVVFTLGATSAGIFLQEALMPENDYV